MKEGMLAEFQALYKSQHCRYDHFFFFTKLKGNVPPASGTGEVRVRIWESFSRYTWRNSYALDPQLNNYKPSQTTVCDDDETKARIPLIHSAKLQQPPHRRPQLAKQPNKVVVVEKRERDCRQILQDESRDSKYHCQAKLRQLTCIECKIIGRWIRHGRNPELSSLHGSNHRLFDMKMSHMWYILTSCHVTSNKNYE